jgi:hypothetical protein
MTLRVIGLCLLLCLATIILGTVYAAPSQPISYQGRLTDVSGNPVPNGTYSVTFTIYTDLSGGSPLWMEEHKINTSDGLFTALLGSVNPFDPALFKEFPRYLGITVDAGPEMTPRILMASVPYALTAPGSTGGYWQQLGSNIYYNSGNVGIGTATPTSALEVNGEVTVSKNDGPRLTFKDNTLGYERPRISFGGDYLAVFDGDSTSGHVFSFMNNFNSVRDYDATLSIHGRTTGSWGTALSLTHNGTHGIISTDVGDILLMPASGNVGIGTTTPGAKLDVGGQVKIADGTQGAGKLLTSDASGLASWQTGVAGSQWTTNGSSIHYNSGNVGIGTATPGAKLDVGGQVKIADGTQGAGKILTSDASGLASWQTGVAGSQWTTAGPSIYYSGRVGIGTSLPTDSLEVNGGVTISKNDGPRLTFKDYNMGGDRPRISFNGDFLTIFDGDAATEHIYSLMNTFSNVRNYDATVRIHGRAANSWNTYLSLTHDGTRGVLSTDVGHISLLPATGFVGIGTITPNAPLGFPAALGKKITLYPGATGYRSILIIPMPMLLSAMMLLVRSTSDLQ